VAKATQSGFDDRQEAVKVGGSGMDMGFALVYELSRALFPNGFGEVCTKCGLRRCVKQDDDSTATGNGLCTSLNRPRTISPETPWKHEYCGRNGNTSGWDNDGGYALTQRWL